MLKYLKKIKIFFKIINVRVLIINFKNYLEVSAIKTINLALAAQKVAETLEAEIVLAPPQPSIGLVTEKVNIPVICQHVDDAEVTRFEQRNPGFGFL